ncbi:MAG: type II toxin-antitoxin system HicB family antitoxin [Candidatus Binataceae bacterium]|jgi:predicted RNase H-like HicB family nuclease
MAIRIEVEREDDGRWLAEVIGLPGVMAYGGAEREAIDKAKALALRVIADLIEHGESMPEPLSSIFTVRAVTA